MRLFAFFGSLLVMALLAALVVPPWVDWNQFRDKFEAEASLLLGVPVKVNGQTSARLLPLPSVTFTDIRIGDQVGKGAGLAADSFTLDMELAPLLKGDVVIVDMVLKRPTLSTSLDENGHLVLPQRATDRERLVDGEVEFQHISITDGVIKLSDPRFGKDIVLRDINISGSSRSLAGPWRTDGTLVHEEEKYRLSVSTGRWQNNGQMRLQVDLEPQALPYTLSYDGPFSMTDLAPSMNGKLTIAPIGSQSARDRIEFPRPAPETALPVTLEADIELGTGGATIPAFELKVGDVDDPYIVTGNGQALFADTISFRVRAEGQQMNVDRLALEQSGGASLKSRLESMRGMINRIPRFDLDGEVNLYLPAVIAGDTVIREVGMDLRPAADGAGWKVSNLEALFPGRTDLRADGVLLVGDNLQYDGDLLIASKQPSGLATWLNADSSSAMRQLSAAGFSAKAKLAQGASRFETVEIVLDDQVLKGSVLREMVEGGRPKLVADLSGNKANYEQLSALFDLFSGSAEGGGIEAHDLDLKLQADNFSMAGVLANGFSTSLQLSAGTLTLDQLQIDDLEGTAVKASGKVEEWTNKALGTVTATFAAANPEPFIALMNQRFGPFPFAGAVTRQPELFSDLDLSVNFDGTNAGYSVAVAGKSGGSEIDAFIKGDKFAEAFAQQTIDSKLVLVNDRYSALMAQLGFPVLPLENDGRGAFRATASGVIADGLRTEGALTVNDGFLSLSGSATPTFAEGEVSVVARQSFTAEFLDFDQFILLSGLPLPGFGEGGAAKISGELNVSPAKLSATGISGNLKTTDFSGDLVVDLARQPRPVVSGSIAFSTIDLPTAAALVFTGTPGSAFTSGLRDGSGLAVSERMPPAMAGLDGVVKISAEKVLMLEGQPDVGKLSANVSLNDGDLGFSDISANWLDGKLSGNFSFAQSSSARLINGQLGLEDAGLSKLLAIAGIGGDNGAELASGVISAQGTFESAGANGADLIAGLTASGVARVANGRIEGLNSKALKPVLRAADAIKDDEVSSKAKELLEDSLVVGGFDFPDTEIPFTVAAGTLRVNSLRVANSDVAVTAEGRLDLGSNDAEANLKLRFDPGKEAVVGASPEFSIDLTKSGGTVGRKVDASLFATYLGMRISERREREFEAQRAEVLERQRLMQTTRLYALEEQAERLAAEERERIRQLEIEQEERRKQEEARRRLEEIEQKKIEAALKAAQEEAAREAALEAGRREKRQQEIDLLRQRSLEALERLREQQDFVPAPGQPVIQN